MNMHPDGVFRSCTHETIEICRKAYRTLSIVQGAACWSCAFGSGMAYMCTRSSCCQHVSQPLLIVWND